MVDVNDLSISELEKILAEKIKAEEPKPSKTGILSKSIYCIEPEYSISDFFWPVSYFEDYDPLPLGSEAEVKAGLIKIKNNMLADLEKTIDQCIRVKVLMDAGTKFERWSQDTGSGMRHRWYPENSDDYYPYDFHYDNGFTDHWAQRHLKDIKKYGE